MENAKKSIWIISPWLGQTYAKALSEQSCRGIEVRIITSKNEYNSDALRIFKEYTNANLLLLVLDQNKARFIHSKIYLVDKYFGISGSANLTYSGLNKNVESLSIAETQNEFEQLETDFMRVWMSYERKGMSKEQIAQETVFTIKNALPLVHNYVDKDENNFGKKELVYYPYYFFEFRYRGRLSSPPKIFKDEGILLLDGSSRKITNDTLIMKEIELSNKSDYVLATRNKIKLQINKSNIQDFSVARELILDYIIEKNTKKYKKQYGDKSYSKLFIPRRLDINLLRSEFVQVPIWYIDKSNPDGTRYQDTVMGFSGKILARIHYCSTCQEKISEKNKKLLHKLIEDGKKDIESKRNLVNKDMGIIAFSLIDCIDESVFKTPDIFFSVIFDLWKNLKLI